MKKRDQDHTGVKEKLSLALKRYKGIPIETDLESYRMVVENIRSFRMSRIGDAGLRDRALGIRDSAGPGRPPAEVVPEFFAVTAEVVRRVLGLEAFDTQLIAAVVLYLEKLAQVRTGEGKTLAAVFPAALNGLSGRGVHVLTANEYLAGRDAEWMGDVYRMLGLRVGSVRATMDRCEKKEIYNRDVIYLTAKQAGFDFLSDGLRYDSSRRCMRPFDYCIVDEADFIMIDEARNPMVIAGKTDRSGIDPAEVDRFVRTLKEGRHFTVDRHGRNCFLTLEGQGTVEQRLGCGGIHEEASFPLYAAVNVGLHAHHLLKKDVDYLVRHGCVELIDESTGRIARNRRWPYGIQTAIEVKEGINPREEGDILGSITVQHFLGLYPRIAAMTATAVSAASEFSRFYGLDTVIIPPANRERMEHLPDLVFSTMEAKNNALANEIERVHAGGRPVLVGTRTVKESRNLSRVLSRRGVPHEVLNAKNDEKEAALVAKAGIRGAVTISTNMAGRGTDIRLGGPGGEDRETIAALGGLCVLGTNRFESVRVDNQLRGRAGRQGDPGSSRFFISLEDDLITRYAITDFIPGQYIGDFSPDAIPDPAVAREIARAQEIIEEQHFQMRTTLRRYSELVERQRRRLAEIREGASDENLFPETLMELCKDSFEAASGLYGTDTATGVLKRVFLRRLDTLWSDHLAWVEHVKEGIHLRRLGNEDPLLAFIRDTVEAFDAGVDSMIREAAETFLSLTPGEFSRMSEEPEYAGPASTWTYLVNDNPFPNFRVSLLGAGGASNPAAALGAVFLAPVLFLSRIVRKRR